MNDFEDYMNWPQHKIDALFYQMFGSDYKALADFGKQVEEEIVKREIEETDEIFDMCEDKTYLAKDMLKEIGIDC